MLSLIFFGWGIYMYFRGVATDIEKIRLLYFATTGVFFVLGFVALNMGV